MNKRRYLLISVLPLALLLLLLALSRGAGVPQPVLAGPDAIPGRYIVMLKDGVNSGVAAADMGRQWGFAADTVYSSAVHGFAANMTDAEARALARDPSVALVQPDQRVSADLHTNIVQTVPTGVDRIDADQNSTANITNQANGTQLNIDVAVIDTGVDTQHPDLNVAGGVGFWGTNCSNTTYEDGFGHGTHVSGTIAARDDNRGAVGVAPGARIWAVKVLGADGSGSNSCVIAGIDWVTDRRKEFNDGVGDGDPGIDIKVVNMSLGGPADGPASADLMCQAIDSGVNAGVIFAVAAGNSSEDASNFSPAHCTSPVVVSAFADFDGMPGGFCNGGACLPLYLTCQNCFQNTFSSCPQGNQLVRDDTFACFSNYGADVDIAAPGADIISTYPATVQGAPTCAGAHCYAVMSGTSMATPHVTGALALFLLATGYSGSADSASVMSAFTAAGYTQPQNSPCGFSGDPGSEPMLYVGNSCAAGSTPSPTASASPVPSPTNSPTPTPSPTLSPAPPSPTPTPTPSPADSPVPTESPSPTDSPPPSPTPTLTPSPTQPPAPTATPSPSPAAVRIQGDGNCDGRVTVMDSLQILLDLGDLTNSVACAGAADVNCNGHLDASDVLLILQYLSGHAALVAQCPAVGAHI